jgi:NADH-quinone oxidoreductase subunit C
MPDETKPEGATAPPTGEPEAPAVSEAKPSEGKPANARPVEAKPAEAKPAAEAKPLAAAKPAAPAAAAAPKAPPPPKAPPVAPTPWEGELPARLKAKFGAAVLESSTFLGQNYFVVEAARIEEICFFLRDDEQYNMLADLTAVDYPKKDKRFEVVYQLYSFPKNERLRVKAAVAESEPISTVVKVWIAANWLEREAYDMFGISFEGHPDLRRILLPEDWQGFPLRKDHHILQQDDQWVRENLNIESGQ